MRSIRHADRVAAAARARAGAVKAPGAVKAERAAPQAAQPAPSAGATPQYYGPYPNYAYSPILQKFVDSLPGVGAANKNNLGNYIPIAVPDTKTFPGSDYYQIGLFDYTQQMHSSLPATKLRGYRDLNNPADPANHYLGPLIVAKVGTPVRVKFSNNLGTAAAGNLMVPVDTTLMGAGMGPNGGSYTQSRSVIHLHGGDAPWISDGTPHQWITPAGENTTLPKGVSFQNVPDMIGAGKPIPNPAAGDGLATYYWPNSDTTHSARLMFYHDHAYGITRLNVYAGVAAGYLLHDNAEDGLIANGVLPNQGGGVYNWGIPLVIQDKTFVSNTTLQTDPTWASLPVPQSVGSLWFPHVYMPNQSPIDPQGVNAVGRWDYGPWFWPPSGPLTYPPVQCAGMAPGVLCPATPNPSHVPEAFMDTPVVNGQAYPYLNVGRQAYRFRILNASNDRSLNLQLYYAATPPAPGAFNGTVCKGTGTASACTEVNMAAAIPHSLNPYRDPTGQDADDPLPLCPANAATDPVTGQPVLAGGAPCWPANWPTDGREGGVPDPAAAGPQFIQIGNESGFQPNVALIPAAPVNFEYNRRTAVMMNVTTKGVYLGPAERADLIIDFSQVPEGSTIMLYNDAPTPMPLFDPRYDFYTGDPDHSNGPAGDGTGGAPSTQPGYGPNTRTILQFRVSSAYNYTGGLPFSLATLQQQLPAAYRASQKAPIVPESYFNAAYGTTWKDNWAKVQDFAFTFTPAGSPTPVTLNLQHKTIVEDFETDYGRMNAQLGVEMGFLTILQQTAIPYFYVDPPTEVIKDGETQLWKVTHNGVDTHTLHFHLFDVQLINRVGWDGQMRGPDPNEEGWKESVRMNPLEDAIVALRPIKPPVPWPLPDSIRPLDVTQALGTNLQFTGADPQNQPAPVSNQLINFGWEYVWHCHLLGHEENDMMRPVVLQVALEAPTNLGCASVNPGCATTGAVTLTWKVNSAAQQSWTVQRATNGSFSAGLTSWTVAASANTFADKTALAAGTYYYRVFGTKSAYGGYSATPAPTVKTITVQSTASNTFTVTR